MPRAKRENTGVRLLCTAGSEIERCSPTTDSLDMARASLMKLAACHSNVDSCWSMRQPPIWIPTENLDTLAMCCCSIQAHGNKSLPRVEALPINEIEQVVIDCTHCWSRHIRHDSTLEFNVTRTEWCMFRFNPQDGMRSVVGIGRQRCFGACTSSKPLGAWVYRRVAPAAHRCATCETMRKHY